MKRRDFLGVGVGSAIVATSVSPWSMLAAFGADASRRATGWSARATFGCGSSR